MFDYVIKSKSELITNCATKLVSIYESSDSYDKLIWAVETLLGKPTDPDPSLYSKSMKVINTNMPKPRSRYFIPTKNRVFHNILWTLECCEFCRSANEHGYSTEWEHIATAFMENIKTMDM